MVHTVNWVEVKNTQGGKTFLKAELIDEHGTRHDVTIWPEYSQYNEVKAGAKITGTVKVNGKYKNFADEDQTGAHIRVPGAGGNGKTAAIRQAMDRKEEGIKTSSTVRDATLITVAQFAGKGFTDQEFKDKWESWRRWLSQAWDAPEIPF